MVEILRYIESTHCIKKRFLEPRQVSEAVVRWNWLNKILKISVWLVVMLDKHQLHGTTLLDGEDIATYAHRLVDIHDRVVLGVGSVNAHTFVMYLSTGLPEQFAHTVGSIQNDTMDFEQAIIVYYYACTVLKLIIQPTKFINASYNSFVPD